MSAPIATPKAGSTPRAGSALNASPAPIFDRELLLIMLVQSLFGLSFSSFLVLPKFLKLELAANAEQIGWMAGAALGAGALFSPLCGAAVERFDRRLILLCALAAEMIAALAFLTVDRVGPFSLLLRVAQGLSFVTVFTTNSALVADTVDNGRLGQALGYLGASMLVTNAVAPLVAEPVAMRFGWNYVFCGAGVASGITMLVIGLLPRDQRQARAQNAPVKEVSWSRTTLPVQFGSLLMGAGLGVMFTYVQPFAIERGARAVGSMFVGYAATATCVRVVLGAAADRLGPARVATLALALYACTVLATPRLVPDGLLYIGIGLGVSHGLLYPSLTAAGLVAVPRTGRARFLGWFSFCFNAGFALTVLLLGPVADRFGYPVIFVTTGILLGVGTLPLLRFALRARSVPA